MAIIKLHTPTHMQDDETTTEFEANDIKHVASVVGNDEREGTHFYLTGVSERQFCTEPAKQVKQLVAENRDKPQKVGTHIFNFYHNQGPVQIGDENNQTVVQNFGASAGEIVRLLHECRDLLQDVSSENRTSASELLDTITAQVNSSKPDKTILKAAFLGLSSMMVRGTAFALKMHALIASVATVYHDLRPLLGRFHH